MGEQTAQVQVADNPDNNRFEGYIDDELVGVIEHIPLESKVIATHTEVASAHEGQGVGSQLVAGALALLRDGDRLVQPLCPYVTAYLRRHPEYSDVVDPTTPH